MENTGRLIQQRSLIETSRRVKDGAFVLHYKRHISIWVFVTLWISLNWQHSERLQTVFTHTFACLVWTWHWGGRWLSTHKAVKRSRPTIAICDHFKDFPFQYQFYHLLAGFQHHRLFRLLPFSNFFPFNYLSSKVITSVLFCMLKQVQNKRIRKLLVMRFS